MSPFVHAIATGVLVVWVGTLTVPVWRWYRQPWRYDGQPVYRRLRDGRIRFTWSVARGFGQAQRQHHDLVVERRLSRLERHLELGDELDDDTMPIQRHPGS